jgi:hypothetical protein
MLITCDMMRREVYLLVPSLGGSERTWRDLTSGEEADTLATSQSQ